MAMATVATAVTDPDRVHHPLFARFYARFSRKAEAHGAAAHRDKLLAGLSGEVVEVGAGNGLNFAHYPDTVARVVAVEPEAYLREKAAAATGHAEVKVDVVPGVAERLPLEDASVDAGIASLVLCSVPDQARALAELRRVIRPGGELRFYEHVRSDRDGYARLEDLADPVWTRMAGGCHINRDTTTAIRAAGFEIESIERFPFDATVVPIAHILGMARRP
jgi:SAM-dependent methyltransferase